MSKFQISLKRALATYLIVAVVLGANVWPYFPRLKSFDSVCRLVDDSRSFGFPFCFYPTYVADYDVHKLIPINEINIGALFGDLLTLLLVLYTLSRIFRARRH